MTILLRGPLSVCALKRVLLLGMVGFSLVSCAPPAPVVITVMAVTVEPRIVTVEIPVEVTREVTRQIVVAQEVPVTREVPVTQLVPVTVTPQPTNLPLPYSGRWSPAGPMTIPRGLHTATVLRDGRVLLVGGITAGDEDTASAEIFDPATNTFSPTGSLNTARHAHSATLLPDGRVLVIAGFHRGWLSDAEIYDPARGLWSVTQPIFAHGVVHVATLLRDGRVLVMGGAKQSGPSGPDDRVEIFDPRTNAWQVAAYHENTDAGAAGILLTDGRVLVAGGTADPVLYDPGTDAWQVAGKLVISRSQAQAALLPGGRVLLCGGIPFSNGVMVLNSVEIYDPVSNLWQVAAPLGRARYSHTATVLPDGRVLIVGGWEFYEQAFLNSAEVYDAASGTWSLLAPLSMGRVYHTATLLSDGRVLVTGGQISRGIFLYSTEVLAP